LSLRRLTLSGRGAGDGNIELEIPDGYAGDSLKIIVVSDGWRDIRVEKAVDWKFVEI